MGAGRVCPTSLKPGLAVLIEQSPDQIRQELVVTAQEPGEVEVSRVAWGSIIELATQIISSRTNGSVSPMDTISALTWALTPR